MDRKRRRTSNRTRTVHKAGMYNEDDKENASPRQSCRKASLTASFLIEEFKKEEQIYQDGEAEKENMVPLLSFNNIRRSPSVEIIEQNNEDPEQEVNDNENELGTPETTYEVESILAESDQVGRLMYLLKWKGYTYDESTWAEEADMRCSHLLKKYAARNELMARMCSSHGTKVVWPYRNAWMSYAFYPCREWEDTINRLISPYGHAKIYVENLVDEAAAPENFEYGIKSRVSDRASKLLEINMEQNAFCECLQGNCAKNKNCICSKMGIPYTKQGRLSRRYRDKPSIFECSEFCGCDEDCPLRMVQRGRKFPIVLFRTLHKGWSLRSAVDIPSGSYVAEYIGEVITSREADSTGSTEYQFQVNGKLNDGQFVIDAANFGNEGEELTINYWNDEQYEGVDKAQQKKKRKCLCQSKECRGFMP
ncbi:pre-SET motif domain-containing protein [Ditylenchus destructor]|nr:pre-SET motif domain-containing protein [Ditylenchus destructor]